jgi:hypothetical protein
VRRFDPAQAAVALELQQLVSEFAYEIDANGARNVTDYYTEDAVFAVGDFARRGHAEIRQFYADSDAKAAASCKDGRRVRWHTFVNLRFDIADQDNGTVWFTNVHYTGEGHPPVIAPISPAMVTDCRMVCRREADGLFRIVHFDGKPIFVGVNDPMSRAALLKT